MEIIKVLVGWEDKNYSAVAECNGVVVATHKDFEMLKKEFTEAFAFLDGTSVLLTYVD